MKKRMDFRIGDIILVAFILMLAVFLFVLPFSKEKSDFAEIVFAENGEIKTVVLSKNSEFNITSRGIKLTVCVKNGEIFIKNSNCRDGVCKNTLPISRKGQSIVCAPAGIVVRIAGEGKIVDGVSG